MLVGGEPGEVALRAQRRERFLHQRPGLPLDRGGGAADASTCDAPIGGDEAVLAPSGASAAHYYVCDYGRATIMKCPDSLIFNPSQLLCDFPSQAGRNTAVTAGAAKLRALPLPLPVTITTLNAHVTDSGRDLPGAKVTFKTTIGTTLCTAVTDWNRKASCDATNLLTNVQTLLLGYTASYAGTADGIPAASAQGTVSLL